MFDIGPGEMIALAVLALLVLGPDKLPGYAADAARFIRQVRNLANDAKGEVRREFSSDLDGLDLRELNPRSLVRKHVLSELDGLDDTDGPTTTPKASPTTTPTTTLAATPTTTPAATPTTTPYDPDTT